MDNPTGTQSVFYPREKRRPSLEENGQYVTKMLVRFHQMFLDATAI